VLSANAEFAEDFGLAGLPGKAAKGLAVLTCMDTRIDPLSMLGLRPGDAKILRNAGARVTADIVNTLVLARYLLGVDRVMVIAHTRCRMASGTAADLHAAIAEAGGPDTSDIAFVTAPDQQAALGEDVQQLRSSPYLTDLTVAGFLYDVDTGRLATVC
jgi:carbonic anhydrase